VTVDGVSWPTIVISIILTQIPTHLNRSANLVIRLFAYIVLGSAFSWWDMLAYGIGIGGISLGDKLGIREKANG